MWNIFWQGLFPKQCLLCRTEGAWLCEKHHTFPLAPANQVTYQYVDEIFAVTAYNDPIVKIVIEYFKFRGFRQLAPIIAKAMTTQLPTAIWSTGPIVPIPLHWRRQLWRGYNQAHLIVQHLPTDTKPYLKRKKHTLQQARCSKVERIQNLQNAFEWCATDAPETIILVDDVVASGQTLDQAAKTAKAAGVKRVIAVVFARGGS